MRVTARSLRFVVGVACGVSAALGSVPAAQAATACPASFAVQHDDRIGNLDLPKGSYQVRVTGALTCSRATSLFATFLQDYDGVLQGGWRYRARGVGQGSFTHRRPSASFSVTRRRGGGGGPPVVRLTCPSAFRVLNDDVIGELPVPAGRYRLTRLSAVSPTCEQASTLFASFLEHPDGRLPGGWAVLAEEGAFVKGSLNNGFRIEPFA